MEREKGGMKEREEGERDIEIRQKMRKMKENKVRKVNVTRKG